MYAVIKTGGKQYRVSPGDKLRVESLNVDEGESINIEQVLMVGEGGDASIGSPLVEGAQVSAKILSHGREKKVRIVKFRRRKHHRKQMGHRQNYTEIEITSVNGVTAAQGAKSTASANKKPAASDSSNNDASASIDQAAGIAGAASAAATHGEPDDLKLISGVGPVLEGKLNELGIYHFWQVAKFEAKDIDLVNDAMAFPGRIERDEWIDQARNLADGGDPK
ncbi:UNVERIFIED_CONTAM: hypothetical protein GTU68_031199 [Idotea baltica]|nr:hypothetical protein [Idotea baltica]